MAGLSVLCAAAPARGGLFLIESLGNFPDAVAVTAEFDTFTNLNINGDIINDTGFVFTVANTSWGNGLSSSFAVSPDMDFAGFFGLLSPAAFVAHRG